ncbi:hypothetical protein P7B02_04315 [Caulobacter segnis]|uniref:hypothetical protein n=1 Tax=Caulobacter segnis TaxID=88688 RepID=UPI002410880C|nr:hypothetical protein [Caulobacter segnis]MDG2520758.1 hypothetical protein [Caulobacter segnis]
MVQRFCVEAFDSVGDRSPSHTEIVGSSAQAERRAAELGFRHPEVRVIDLSDDEPTARPALPTSAFEDRFLRRQ